MILLRPRVAIDLDGDLVGGSIISCFGGSVHHENSFSSGGSSPRAIASLMIESLQELYISLIAVLRSGYIFTVSFMWFWTWPIISIATGPMYLLGINTY